MKRLVLLGASGSIGKQTLDVVKQHPDLFSIEALSVGKNIESLKEILSDFDIKEVCVQQQEDCEILQKEYPSIHFTYGEDGLKYLSELEEYDVLVNALVGFVGFMPTLSAIRHKHDVALANKETLVVGGELIKRALEEYGCKLYPIDSEHSAIFQCLQGNRSEDVKRLIITASGGAFREKTRDELKDVTLADALAHPNWSMGDKITVDCANMMNKGFEVIEAHWLFDMPFEKIDVVMHQESIVHSMVEYVDGSVMAQMGTPDMRLPIQYALSYPDRFERKADALDLCSVGELHFKEPDVRRYPLLALAYQCGEKGGNKPAVMNAVNDVANEAFRNGEISFLMIEDLIITAVNTVPFKKIETVEDLLEANKWGHQFALEKIKGVKQ